MDAGNAPALCKLLGFAASSTWQSGDFAVTVWLRSHSTRYCEVAMVALAALAQYNASEVAASLRAKAS